MIHTTPDIKKTCKASLIVKREVVNKTKATKWMGNVKPELISYVTCTIHRTR